MGRAKGMAVAAKAASEEKVASAMTGRRAAASAAGGGRRKAASSATPKREIQASAEAVPSTRKGKAASAERKIQASAEAGGSTTKRKAASTAEELKIQKVKKQEDLKMQRAKKEEERKIHKLKKEEGKILKLKKAVAAAEEDAWSKLPPSYRPVKPAAEQQSKKKKKILVRRLFPQEHIDALLAMPCPFTPLELTKEEQAIECQEFKDFYNQEMNITKLQRDYHQALIDQHSIYGYAVDESEIEVTDDEDGGDL